jgi:hypothetical protein
MPAPLRIILTPEEDLTLTELRLAQTIVLYLIAPSYLHGSFWN